MVARAAILAAGFALVLCVAIPARCAADGREAIELPGCTEPAGLAAQLVEPADLAARCAGDAACWRAGLEQARALRDRHPGVYDAHRAYVLVARAAARVAGPEVAAAVAAEYRELAASHPGNPAYPHLVAQLALDGAAYRAELERLAREFPDYPWAQLSLAFQVRPDSTDDERTVALAALDRFAAVCPDRVVERERALELVGSADALLAAEPDLEKRALAEGDVETLARLWSQVLRLVPEDRREGLRAPAAAAVQALANAPAGGTGAGLRARAAGAELAGDREARLHAEDAILERFPCTDDASRVRSVRWRERGHPPNRDDEAAWTAWRDSFLAEIERTLATCPEDEWALRRKVQLLESAPKIDETALFATVDRILALPHRRFGAWPSDPGWVARICLDHDLRLDRVPALLEADRADARAQHERRARSGDSGADAAFAWRQRENLRLTVRLALTTGRVADARRALDALSTATAAAPDGGRAAPGPGMETFPDERTMLDQLSARVAVAEGRPDDALATLAHLLPDRQLAPVVEADARAAWRAAHGSEEGFEAWRESLAGGEASSGWKVVDRPLPAVPVSEFGAGPWRWEERRGKTVVVAVWATWCAPCRAELPVLARLPGRLGKRSDVEVVSLNVDRSNASLVPFLAETEPDLAVLVGGDALFDHGLLGVPTTWIVSPQGRIVRELQGFGGTEEEWLTAAAREVEAVAGPPPAAAPAS
jgi:thiol-disulfide isomerase/thioredoxin